MMKTLDGVLQSMLLATCLVVTSAVIAAEYRTSGMTTLERQVRHELVMLPYYGVFDNLEFRVDGATVILGGQVTRPSLKRDAERAVQRLESVDRVVNQIEVLPTSQFDDDIRVATYWAIYRHPALQQYQLRSVPPIHIIVKKGHVTLEGVVARVSDKNIAGIQANGVSNVFSVTNNLRVERSS